MSDSVFGEVIDQQKETVASVKNEYSIAVFLLNIFYYVISNVFLLYTFLYPNSGVNASLSLINLIITIALPVIIKYGMYRKLIKLDSKMWKWCSIFMLILMFFSFVALVFCYCIMKFEVHNLDSLVFFSCVIFLLLGFLDRIIWEFLK